MNNKKSLIFYYSLLSQKICLGIFSDETFISLIFLLFFGATQKKIIDFFCVLTIQLKFLNLNLLTYF